MAFRFRLTRRLAPGMRLNIGKKSAGVRIGVKGAGMTVGTAGKRVSAGIPGTGISYTKKLTSRDPAANEPPAERGKGRLLIVAAILCVALIIIAFAKGW